MNINLDPAPPVDGCTVCGSQDTATLDSRHGRRCANCPPRFDADVAVAVALTDPQAAGWYCAAFEDGEAS